MARFNEILVGRYNRLIQKLFGMKGDAALFQFSTEMMAVLPMFMGNENRYLESWTLFGLSLQQAAVAANTSAIPYVPMRIPPPSTFGSHDHPSPRHGNQDPRGGCIRGARTPTR